MTQCSAGLLCLYGKILLRKITLAAYLVFVMSGSSVLYPNESLYLVDRGWRLYNHHRSAARTPTWDGAAIELVRRPTNCSTRGLSGGSAQKCTGAKSPVQSMPSPKFHFVNTTPDGSVVQKQNQRIARSHVQKRGKGAQEHNQQKQQKQREHQARLCKNAVEQCASRPPELNTTTACSPQSQLTASACSGASTPLYGFAGIPESVVVDTRAHQLLGYCLSCP